jgi:hypothetical protein
VFANFCIDEVGRYSGATGERNLFQTLARLWRAFHEDGTITSDELHRATFVQYYRTIAEFRSPFDDPASAVSRAGLVLEHCSSVLTPLEQLPRARMRRHTRAFAYRASVRSAKALSWTRSSRDGRRRSGRRSSTASTLPTRLTSRRHPRLTAGRPFIASCGYPRWCELVTGPS